jgi:hypothetical protein
MIKMCIGDEEDEIEFIQENCKGEKYKPPESKQYKDIYSHQIDRCTLAKILYDFEDVWQVFQQRPKIKKYLQKNDVLDMAELINHIKEKKNSDYYANKHNFDDKVGDSYISGNLFDDQVEYTNIDDIFIDKF